MKKLPLIISVAAVILLGLVILFRPPSTPEEPPMPELLPGEQLELFMTDRMDYGVRLSEVLAKRRIARAEQLAEQHPELEFRAREVIDSLRARLARKAVTK
ncbi:MAG: hypothetical protein JXA28_01570 [Bacteroidetes bacterium]|nr:hypothetical protein [Bacteroidota bacterium]